jgi:hypothetical protein
MAAPPAAPAALAQPEELLRVYCNARRAYCHDGPEHIDWQRDAERGATLAGLGAVLTRWGRPAAPPAPEVGEGEVAELVEWMRGQVTIAPAAQTQWAKRFLRAATLLSQQAAPTPVPVAVSERLPGEGDCDADGFCWNGYGYSYDDKNEIDSYAMWMLVPASDLRGRVWAASHAIPLPQVGEGEA